MPPFEIADRWSFICPVSRRSHSGQSNADQFSAGTLQAEVEERERGTIDRRIKGARLPRFKTLDEFDFAATPQVSPTLLHSLAEGGYLEKAEPIIFIGDSGTGTRKYR